MVASNVVVGALAPCVLVYSVRDLKDAQMNELHMLYKFELGHNAVEATKNISCVKRKVAVDHSIVSKKFKTFHSGCKMFDDQARSGRLKIWIPNIKGKSDE